MILEPSGVFEQACISHLKVVSSVDARSRIGLKSGNCWGSHLVNRYSDAANCGVVL
jgi:hypothetical protein